MSQLSEGKKPDPIYLLHLRIKHGWKIVKIVKIGKLFKKFQKLLVQDVRYIGSNLQCSKDDPWQSFTLI